MSKLILCESDYLAAIQAALAIDAIAEVLDSMVGIAEGYLNEGLTQEGADVLAFVLGHAETDADTYERAFDLFDDLESRICPRVIWDAKAFASGVALQDMIDYVFADDFDE